MLRELGCADVVPKLDFFSRDALDVLATVKTLTALDVEVVVLQLAKLELTSFAGKALPAMLAAVAEMERSLIIERPKQE